MSTKVYALWCSADYYQTVLRGLYFDKGQAEIDCEVEGVERQPNRLEIADGVGPHCVTYKHGWCCSIEEVEIRDRAIGAVALPEKPYDRAVGLIPLAVEAAIIRSFREPPPFTTRRESAND